MARMNIWITLAQNEFDNTTDAAGSVDWDTFSRMEHDRREDKNQGSPGQRLGFSVTRFAPGPCMCGAKPGVTKDLKTGKETHHIGCPDFDYQEGNEPRGHRTARNVLGVSLIGCDLDKDDSGQSLTEPVAQEYLASLRATGIAMVVWSTHSYAPPDKCSLRVFILPDREITAQEWSRGVFAELMSRLGIPSGIGTKPDARRFWFAPSAKPGASVIHEVMPGGPVEVDELLVNLPVASAKPTYVARASVGAFDFDEAMALWCPDAVFHDHSASERRASVECPNAHEHTTPGTIGMVFDYRPGGGTWHYRCQHGHCADFGWEWFRAQHDPDYADGRALLGNEDEREATREEMARLLLKTAQPPPVVTIESLRSENTSLRSEIESLREQRDTAWAEHHAAMRLVNWLRTHVKVKP